MSEWQDAWKGIWSTFDKMGKRVDDDQKEGRLMGGQAGLIKGFIFDLENELKELENLETKIASKGMGSPDPAVRDTFKGIFNSLHSLAIGTSPLREGMPNRLLNEVWGHGLRVVTNFLERRAEAVGVESWSLSATVGFPSGVSGTLGIYFKR